MEIEPFQVRLVDLVIGTKYNVTFITNFAFFIL
jgi:hypothetical protein